MLILMPSRLPQLGVDLPLVIDEELITVITTGIHHHPPRLTNHLSMVLVHRDVSHPRTSTMDTDTTPIDLITAHSMSNLICLGRSHSATVRRHSDQAAAAWAAFSTPLGLAWVLDLTC